MCQAGCYRVRSQQRGERPGLIGWTESQLTQLSICSSADSVDWRSNCTGQDYPNSISNVFDYIDMMSVETGMSSDLEKTHRSVGF